MSDDRITPINDKLNQLNDGERKALLAKLKSRKNHLNEEITTPVDSLSRAQGRLWVIDQLSRCPYLYHVPLVLPLSKQINLVDLKLAFEHLVKKNPILASYFLVENDEVKQYHDPLCDFNIEIIESNDSLPHFVDLHDASILTEFFLRQFSKNKAPLFRLALLATPDQSFLLMCFHHLIIDGWSMRIIIEQMEHCYQLAINKNLHALNPSEDSYFHFISWEKKQQLHRSEKCIDYWMERLDGKSHIVDLMTDFPRMSILSGRGRTIHFPVSKIIFSQLEEFARSKTCSLNQLILFGFQFMLSRFSGQDDITVGIPVAGRADSRWYNTIGLFVNTCLHTLYIDYQKTITEQLDQVKKYLLADMENANEPFDEVVKELYARRQLSPNNTFNILYNFIQSSVGAIETECLDLKSPTYYCALPISKFDLSLHVFATASTLDLFIEYSTDLYYEETVYQMMDYLFRLLETLVIYKDETLKTWTWALAGLGKSDE